MLKARSHRLLVARGRDPAGIVVDAHRSLPLAKVIDDGLYWGGLRPPAPPLVAAPMGSGTGRWAKVGVGACEVPHAGQPSAHENDPAKPCGGSAPRLTAVQVIE